MRPITFTGTSSSGISFVASRWSNGERVRFLLCKELNRKFPLRKVAGSDGVEHVAPVKIRVSARDLDRLVPDGRLQTQLWAPMELHESRLAGIVNQSKTMDTESLDHPQRARQRAIGHDPHHHVHRFWREGNKIPEGVVRCCGLRETSVRLHFHGMDEIWEFDGILNEEDGNVISDQIPVSFLRVKLHRKPAYVPRRVHRTSTACDGGQSCKDGRLLTNLGEYSGGGVFLDRRGQLEISMHTCSSCVNDTFGNTLVIKMRDLFAQD